MSSPIKPTNDSDIADQGECANPHFDMQQASQAKRSSPPETKISSQLSSTTVGVDYSQKELNRLIKAPRAMSDGDARWEGMLEGLQDYQRRHNSLNVPRDYKWNNKSLYEWCRNNRKHYLNGLRGKSPALFPKRIQRLREIGFDLDPTGAHRQKSEEDDKRWATMYEGLLEFHRRYGSFAVPIGYMCDGRSLHDWLRHQRKQYSTLIDGRPALVSTRIDRLLSIGFDLDPTGQRKDHRTDQERWDVMFQGLQDFYRRNGTFAVPDGTLHDGRNLASWAHNQKRLYAHNVQNQQSMLLSERTAKLLSIGFVLRRPRSLDGASTINGPLSLTQLVQYEAEANAGVNHEQDTQVIIQNSSWGVAHAQSTVSYAFTVTTDSEREAVPEIAQTLAYQALTLYQAMTVDERINWLNRSRPQKRKRKWN